MSGSTVGPRIFRWPLKDQALLEATTVQDEALLAATSGPGTVRATIGLRTVRRPFKVRALFGGH